MIIMDSFLGQHNPLNYFALTKEITQLSIILYFLYQSFYEIE